MVVSRVAAGLLAVSLVNVVVCLNLRGTSGLQDLELCQRGKVRIVLAGTEDGIEDRQMIFGDENGVESEVRCKVEKGCVNSEHTCGCPCEYVVGQKLNAPYMKTIMSQMAPICESFAKSKVLMIGLGGGELAQYMMYNCNQIYLTAVEISDEVVDAAMNAFGLRVTQDKFPGMLEVKSTDSMSALKETSGGAYDAVIVDCFAQRGEVPLDCRSEAFAKQVSRVLKPAGFSLQNMWSYSWDSKRVASDFNQTVALYKDLFPNAVKDIHVPMPALIDFVEIIRIDKI